MNSTRAELFVILLAIRTINATAEWGQITGKAEIACDSTAALQSTEQEWTTNSLISDMDVVNEIRRALKDNRAEIRWRHVKGHAERRKSHTKWDHWERMNVTADSIATKGWDTMQQTNQWGDMQGSVLTEGLVLTAPNRNITSATHEMIAQETNNDTIKQYWTHRWRYQRDEVDWIRIGKASKRELDYRWSTFIKLATGTAATGKNMTRRNRVFQSTCPRCGEEEDNNHLITCSSRNAKKRWKDTIKKVKRKMRTLGVSTEIIWLVTRNIQQQTKGLPPAGSLRGTIKQRRIIQKQSRMGWLGWIWGGWSKAWAEETMKSGSKEWIHIVISEIWNGILGQWEGRNKIAEKCKHLDEGEAREKIDIVINQIKETPRTQIPPAIRTIWMQPIHDDLIKQLQWMKLMATAMPHIQDNMNPTLSKWIEDRLRDEEY